MGEGSAARALGSALLTLSMVTSCSSSDAPASTGVSDPTDAGRLADGPTPIETGDRWCCTCGTSCSVAQSGGPVSVTVTLGTRPPVTPGECTACIGSSVCSSQTADERRSQCTNLCMARALQLARAQLVSHVSFSDITCSEAGQDDSTFCKDGCSSGDSG